MDDVELLLCAALCPIENFIVAWSNLILLDSALSYIGHVMLV